MALRGADCNNRVKGGFHSLNVKVIMVGTDGNDKLVGWDGSWKWRLVQMEVVGVDWVQIGRTLHWHLDRDLLLPIIRHCSAFWPLPLRSMDRFVE